jgi:hypothetical protein
VPTVTDTFSLGSTGAIWKDIYVGTGSLYLGDAKLSSTGSDLVIYGNIVPASNEAFSIGSTGSRIKELHMGPGTVFIGPTGTLGNDSNGIIYAQQGFAAPTLVLGATIPGATGPVGGGVRLTLTGPTGPIQYRQLDENGGPTGTLYTVAHTVPGSDAAIPSGFTGALNGGASTVNLTNDGPTGTLVAQTSITIHTRSRLFANASVEIVALTSAIETVSLYLVVDGETSNVTTATNRGNGEYSNIVLLHRTAPIAPGTYTVAVYGYCSTAHAVDVTHCDLFAMGNLA